MKKESKPTKSMPYFNEAKNFIIIEKDNIKNMFKTESIAFAEFLKADFEMVDGENGDIYWQLCGTMQNYTTNEIYNEWIKTYINPNLHPAT